MSHGKWETAAPIRAFVPYDHGRHPRGYTCTPVVHFQLADLEAGAKAVGRTVAELGAMNQPLDMVSFVEGGEEHLLVANSRHGLVKIACRDIDSQEPLTEPREPVGVPRETKDLQGITRLANLDDGHVLALQRDRRRASSPADPEDRLAVAAPATAVARLSWSDYDGKQCLRIRAVAASSHIDVRPCTLRVVDGLAPMAGELVHDGEDACFVARFGFFEGRSYVVTVDGVQEPPITVALPRTAPRSSVAAIYPTAAVVPRNLLRLYVWFSGPMAAAQAGRNVRLVDGSGADLKGALLPGEEELWDSGRRRLTLLLDPARIKRGLAAHREVGYPLSTGGTFTVLIEPGFTDAQGSPLRGAAKRSYLVGPDERRHVDPATWLVTPPTAGQVCPLEVRFPGPLDHGLVARCLHVVDPHGRRVDGRVEIGLGERSWSLLPARAWARGRHRIVVDPLLEDVAGNSVSRVFDRYVERPSDAPLPERPVAVPFVAL